IMREIAALVVPTLGDVCAADLVRPGGTARRVEVSSVNPRLAASVVRLRECEPRLAGDSVAARALAEARPIVERQPHAQSAESRWGKRATPELPVQLQALAVLVLPHLARGTALGVLTLVARSPSRRWTADDVALGEELAR